MARGSGPRPWKRGAEADRALNGTVLPSGDMAVTDEGNVYAGDGSTIISALKRLVRFDEVTAAVQQYVTSLVVTNSNLTALAAETGYVYVIPDQNGRWALGVTPDGTVVLNKAQLPDGSIALSKLTSTAQSSIPSTLAAESGWIYAETDQAGNLLGGIRSDGSRSGKGVPPVDGPIAVSANYVAYAARDGSGNPQIRVLNKATGQVSALTTSGRNTAPVLTSDDQVLFRSWDGPATDRWSAMWVPAGGGPTYPMQSLANIIYAPGDSLTAGTGSTTAGTGYPFWLAASLGRQVINDGSGGQTSEQIAARQGGAPATVAFAGNQIAAVTTAQTVTVNVDLLTGAAGQFARTGTISGVHGTLTGATSLGAYTFTRDAAGTAVSLPGATPFIPDALVNYGSQIGVFWAGRNNFKTDAPSVIVGNLQAMAGALRAYSKRYVVLSIPPDASETTGSGVRSQLDAANSALASAFPNSWLDIAAYLRSAQAFTDAGISQTTQDTTDIANGVTPTSLRSDSVHLNDIGYRLVAAQVKNFLTSKGWLL